jgi:hypothetical protein
MTITAVVVVFGVFGCFNATRASTDDGNQDAETSRPNSEADSNSTPDSATSRDAGDNNPDAEGRPAFHTCDNAALPTDLGTDDWDSLSSPADSAVGDPYHSARDRITNPGRSVNLVAKFSYGTIQKDLGGETVSVWIDDCSGSYTKLGEQKTNDEGRVFYPFNPDSLPGPGRYNTFFYVRGDGTSTTGTLRVLPRGTEMVVFDIDGTLTKGDRELANDIITDLFEPLLSGDYVPKARSKAREATEAYRDHHGYQVAYITARPYWLGKRTRSWLATEGMALGALRLSPSTSEALPTNDSVGNYKAGYIRRLNQTLGLEVRRAYGNSTTDIYAYEQGGLSAKEIFVLGEHGGEQQTVDLGDNYDGHVTDIIDTYRSAEQPFQY